MPENFKDEINRIKSVYLMREQQGITHTYSYFNPAFLFHMQERERAILKMLRDVDFQLNEAKVLEVGCGSGHILNRFLEFGAKEVYGIELLENRVAIAKSSYPQIKIIEGNAVNLPYKDNSFDLVTQFMCMSSVLDQQMRLEVAKEMWRVLKPGGGILWYDLRPFFETFTKGNFSQGIHRIDLKELKQLFPLGELKYKGVSLVLKLANFSDKSYFLSYLFSLFPFFRTHYLVFIKKATLQIV